MAVNVDHVHIFFQYPPKYSLSFIAKKIKGRSNRILRKEFPHLKEWCGEHMWAPSCFHGSVGSGEIIKMRRVVNIKLPILSKNSKAVLKNVN